MSSLRPVTCVTLFCSLACGFSSGPKPPSTYECNPGTHLYAPATNPTASRSSAEIRNGDPPPCPDGAYDPARDVLNDCYPPSWCEPSLADCGALQCWYCVREQDLLDWAEESIVESEVTCEADPALGNMKVCVVTCGL